MKKGVVPQSADWKEREFQINVADEVIYSRLGVLTRH